MCNNNKLFILHIVNFCDKRRIHRCLVEEKEKSTRLLLTSVRRSYASTDISIRNNFYSVLRP